MVVLDTTILIYAVGGEHPLRGPCRRIFEANTAGRIEAATTVEVVQEFVHVRSRRHARPDAANVGLSYAANLEIVSARVGDLQLGLTYFKRHPRLGAFDCVLAAVAVNQHAEVLISADRGFADIVGLRWLSPGDPALERLLAGRGRGR